MSYEQTEAKLRALVAQREAERFRNCPTPGCRLEEGHAGLHRFVPEVERLRARVAELEAAEASLRARVEEEIRILSIQNRVSGVDVAERLRSSLSDPPCSERIARRET